MAYLVFYILSGNFISAAGQTEPKNVEFIVVGLSNIHKNLFIDLVFANLVIN